MPEPTQVIEPVVTEVIKEVEKIVEVIPWRRIIPALLIAMLIGWGIHEISGRKKD